MANGKKQMAKGLQAPSFSSQQEHPRIAVAAESWRLKADDFPTFEICRLSLAISNSFSGGLWEPVP
jgi:hypothetical protein